MIITTLEELVALPVGTVIAQFYPPTEHWPASVGPWQAVAILQKVIDFEEEGWSGPGDDQGPYSSQIIADVHLVNPDREAGRDRAEPEFTVLYHPERDLVREEVTAALIEYAKRERPKIEVSNPEAILPLMHHAIQEAKAQGWTEGWEQGYLYGKFSGEEGSSVNPYAEG